MWLAIAVVGLLLFGNAAAFGVCGDGALDGGEACDAGAQNGVSGSCCSASCQIAVGAACPDTTPDDCFQATCNAGGSCIQAGGPPQPTGTACALTQPAQPCLLAQCDGSTCGRLAVAGATCTLPAPNECLSAECSGSSTTCGVPRVVGTACSDATPGDCSQAVCNGSGGCTQMGPLKSLGAACTLDSPDGPCLFAECTGSQSACGRLGTLGEACTLPVPNECLLPQCGGHVTACGVARATEPCSDTTPDDCLAAVCEGTDGIGSCIQAGPRRPAGTPCDDATAGDCLAPRCDDSGTCDDTPAPLPVGTSCQDTAPGNCFLATCEVGGICDQQGAPGPCAAPLVSGRGLLFTDASLLLVGGLALRRVRRRR